jgi:hypothetical protein
MQKENAGIGFFEKYLTLNPKDVYVTWVTRHWFAEEKQHG